MKTYTKGFSLLEILIGVAIISLVFIFAYSAIGFSRTFGADMEEKTKVCNVLETASERILEMANTSQAQYDTIVTGMTLTGIPYFDAADDSDFRNELLPITVSNVDAGGNYKEVTITFQWMPSGRRNIDGGTGLEVRKEESLTIYVSKPTTP